MCSGEKNSKSLLNAIKMAESLINCSNTLISELERISLNEAHKDKIKTYFEFLESTKDLAYKIKYDLIRSALNYKINKETELFIFDKLDTENEQKKNSSKKSSPKKSGYFVDMAGKLVKENNN